MKGKFLLAGQWTRRACIRPGGIDQDVNLPYPPSFSSGKTDKKPNRHL